MPGTHETRTAGFVARHAPLSRGLRLLQWAVALALLAHAVTAAWWFMRPVMSGTAVVTMVVATRFLDVLSWGLFFLGLRLAVRRRWALLTPVALPVAWCAAALMALWSLWLLASIAYASWGPQEPLLPPGWNPILVAQYAPHIAAWAFLLAIARIAHAVNRQFDDRLIGRTHFGCLLGACIVLWTTWTAALVHTLWVLRAGTTGPAVPSGVTVSLLVYGWVEGLGTPIVLGWIWLAMSRARRRLLEGDRCLACGYDLTGNESGACPECGEATGGDRRGIGPATAQPAID